MFEIKYQSLKWNIFKMNEQKSVTIMQIFPFNWCKSMKYKETGNLLITYTSLNITGQRYVRGPSGGSWRQLRTSAEAWRTLYGQTVHHQPQRRVCGWGSRFLYQKVHMKSNLTRKCYGHKSYVIVKTRAFKWQFTIQTVLFLRGT